MVVESLLVFHESDIGRNGQVILIVDLAPIKVSYGSQYDSHLFLAIINLKRGMASMLIVLTLITPWIVSCLQSDFTLNHV